MRFETDHMAAVERLLDWAKRAAVYPKDDGAARWLVMHANQIGEVCEECLPEVQEIQRQWARDSTVFLEDHQVEFTRLFVNRFGGVLAPPYASYYLDSKILLGQSVNTVVDLYGQSGLSWSHVEGAETPDHIAVELEFLQFLAGRIASGETADACQGAGDLWRLFWKNHMNNWLPAFVKNLTQHARTPLYQLLAKILNMLYQKERNDG